MKKNLKYLISLLLVFGLMVNDGTLSFQSNSASYYQCSNVILRRELANEDSKTYLFNQQHSRKVAFSIPVLILTFEKLVSLQTKIILKLQGFLHQKISSFTSQYTFVNEITISKNHFQNLYIS